jgi:hypothetical protein
LDAQRYVPFSSPEENGALCAEKVIAHNEKSCSVLHQPAPPQASAAATIHHSSSRGISCKLWASVDHTSEDPCTPPLGAQLLKIGFPSLTV